MCGICGIYSHSIGIDLPEIVTRMNAALTHRGPDDSGYYHCPCCSLAMRRLSIIDVTGGAQPIFNEDETLVIIFNGEIYNFRELRQELERSGNHHFQTNSDTEVVLHLFEEYGESMLERLNGMFALCIYDQPNDRLFLARDRFGEKPLYYTLTPQGFAFASELRSLVEWSEIERKLDLDALYYYLHIGQPPAPLTLFRGIEQLPPGHYMTLDGKRMQVSIQRYFHLRYKVNEALVDEDAAKEALRASLLQAVERQMISDVPLGALLSGGIDSSAVVATMQRLSSQPIKTFTVRFEHASYDESYVAQEVAKFLGTDHHEYTVGNFSFSDEDLWRIVRHVGQPFYDSSAIPTYLISKLARQHVTVCLSGDGGDEMFAGYAYFQWVLKIDRLSRMMPNVFFRLAEKILGGATHIPGDSAKNAVRQARRVAQAAQLSTTRRPVWIGALFDEHESASLVSGLIWEHWTNNHYGAPETILETCVSSSRLRQLMAYRTLFALPEDMLLKVDRMSMAASLEVRAPMLSVEVSSTASQMPNHMLLRNGVGKYILREAVRSWLPEIVFTHPKTGFNIPLHMILNDNYVRLCRELILEKNGLMQELFVGTALRERLETNLKQHGNTASQSVYRSNHQVWSLLQLAAWGKEFKVTV